MKTKAKQTSTEFDFRTIKSFEDACKKENIDPEKLPDVSMVPETFGKAIINCYKLFIIFKAINNGWIADYTNYSQLKYYPWFEVNSSGSGFDFSVCDFTRTLTGVGSRLCTDTSGKALYIARTFGAEYKEFFF